ncbi:hypothetical protein ACFXTH_031898 [Malus domestica]
MFLILFKTYILQGGPMHLPFSVPPFDSILSAGKWGRVLKLPHFEEFFKVLIVVLQFVRRLPCCTAGSDREAVRETMMMIFEI